NNGMVRLPDGQEIKAQDYYEAIGGSQVDCIYNATNLRIREISLGYTFLDVFGPGKNITVSAIARNLGFIYKDAPVDPDISVSAANGASGIESFALPTTQSFGVNLKLSF
ncbi:MAG: SusC/RagA family TonB-linked outer membrane protein, partial [Bacteroidales bacterium]